MTVETPKNPHNVLIYHNWTEELLKLENVDQETKKNIIYDLVMYGTHGILTYNDDPQVALFLAGKLQAIDKNNAKYDNKVVEGQNFGRPKADVDAEVAELVQYGLTKKAIAERLGVSESTIGRCEAWKNRKGAPKKKKVEEKVEAVAPPKAEFRF